jgi:hypothetical protein
MMELSVVLNWHLTLLTLLEMTNTFRMSFKLFKKIARLYQIYGAGRAAAAFRHIEN